MKRRRIRYILLAVALIVLLRYYLEPAILEQVDQGVKTVDRARFHIMCINVSVTVVFAIIIIFEGKYYKDMQVVGGLLVLSTLMDVFRMNIFPKIAFESYIVSLFTGILIFAFGLVSMRNVIFKNSVGFFFMILGLFNLIRFPVFIDVLYFYFYKFAVNISMYDGYYFGTLYANYIVIFLEVIALDAIVRENLDTFRYEIPQT